MMKQIRSLATGALKNLINWIQKMMLCQLTYIVNNKQQLTSKGSEITLMGIKCLLFGLYS